MYTRCPYSLWVVLKSENAVREEHTYKETNSSYLWVIPASLLACVVVEVTLLLKMMSSLNVFSLAPLKNQITNIESIVMLHTIKSRLFESLSDERVPFVG